MVHCSTTKSVNKVFYLELIPLRERERYYDHLYTPNRTGTMGEVMK